MKKIAFTIAMLSCFFLKSYSQDSLKTINTNLENVLNEMAVKIKDNYIFEPVAKSLDSLIYANIKSGKYKGLSNDGFATAVTKDLRICSNDKHFYMRYVGNSKTEIPPVNSKRQRELDSISNSLENFGFETVSRLKGNIGYINYKGFAEANSSENALTSAMNFVSNTNSLIIDLRENRGGDNDMVILFCSYFFDKSVEPYKTYFRNENKTISYSTKEKVKGIKYIGKNVYFLTSKNSFSAAEAMPYVLQNYKLAKVVGEQTGGAANPENTFIIGNEYMLCIPVGVTTSFITNGNWEHIGIAPDIKTKSENALTVAQILALKEILKNETKTDLSELETKKLIKKLEASLIK